MFYRPRRELILRAIEEAKETEKGKLVITIESITGVSIDAAFMVIKKTESLRDKHFSIHGIRPVGALLRSMVSEAAVASGLPPDRQRAYVLISMRYYLKIRHYVQEARSEATKRRQLLRERRSTRKISTPPLVLTAG
jgi:hypothetical protein